VLVKGFVGARVRMLGGASMWSPFVRRRGGDPGAVLSQIDAVVVLAVVFALAGREEPGVLLAAQSVLLELDDVGRVLASAPVVGRRSCSLRGGGPS